MGTFGPENEIGDQIWARCCGRVALTEPHIAAEKKYQVDIFALKHMREQDQTLILRIPLR